MSRISNVELENAQGKAKELLDGVNQALGIVPNVFKAMANSPAVLQAYLGFSGALKEGSLGAKLQEQIALEVGELNNCQYCLAAHSAIGQGAGLNETEIQDARKGVASDPKVQAALVFAKKVVQNRASVSDQDIEEVKSAGFSEGEVGEIVANVCLNIFTNYFNHVADPQIDFPQVQPIS